MAVGEWLVDATFIHRAVATSGAYGEIKNSMRVKKIRALISVPGKVLLQHSEKQLKIPSMTRRNI